MIKHRFAGRDAAIEHAFASSDSFRGLCRDYLACATVLARWQAADSTDAPVRAEEYAALLSELASEIRMRLQAAERDRHQQPSSGGL
jgi:hypothetical protein